MLHTEFASEQQLFRRVSEGDRNAFRLVFDLYNGRLTTFIYRLTKSETIAAELVQDSVNGIVCEPTPASLGQALRRLIDDEAAAEQMGNAAFAKGAELNWPDAVRQLTA